MTIRNPLMFFLGKKKGRDCFVCILKIILTKIEGWYAWDGFGSELNLSVKFKSGHDGPGELVPAMGGGRYEWDFQDSLGKERLTEVSNVCKPRGAWLLPGLPLNSCVASV